MEEICDFGGDTDTNCAIVGTLIGPLIGYKNFDRELFTIFIKFFPKKRIQYTSAFMYEYVDFLENKYLYINNNNYHNKKNVIDNKNINQDIKNEENKNNQKNNKDNNSPNPNEENEDVIKKENDFIVLKRLMKFLS